MHGLTTAGRRKIDIRFKEIAGLLDTYAGLTIAYTAFNLPFVIWLMRGFFLEIPREAEEAAMVDGCSRFEAFFKVSIPQVASGLVATALFCAILCWAEYLFALVLSGAHSKTIAVAASEVATMRGIEWGDMGAMGVIAAIPVLCLAFLAQKYLVRGLTFGLVHE